MRILATKPNPELVRLPWDVPLEEWEDEHVIPLPRGPLAARRPVRPRRRAHLCGQGDRRAHRPPRVPPAPRPAEARAADRRTAGGGDRPQGQARASGCRARWSPGTCGSRCRTARCSRAACAPTACRRSSTRSSCSSSGCTSQASSGATSRCRTSCSGAARASSRRTSSTPRPASSSRRCRTSSASTTCPSRARTCTASCWTCRPATCSRRTSTRATSSSCSRSGTPTCGARVTAAAEFDTDEMWRIEQWVESLNDLGFDIDEMDIVTEPGGSRCACSRASSRPATTAGSCGR